MTRLWKDDSGFIATTDLLLICTILVIGTVVGLTTLRDQVVQELGDLGAAFAGLNQSYSFAAVTLVFNGSTFTVAGSEFQDMTDDCDTGDPGGAPPACISLSVSASHEG